MVNLLSYGAVGDGKFMNTQAFAAAIADAKGRGETLVVPAGTFLTGTINLQGVSMHLEAGAVIKASSDLADYPPQDYYHNELGVLRALIVNLGCDNVSITGSGTIDFSGHAFYDLDAYDVPGSKVPFSEAQRRECTHPIGPRPAQCLFMHGAKNLVVSGIRLIDAPCWTLTFSECENVKIMGLTIDTDLNIPNDDGIHISACKGVIISDCNISSGDDCIALSCITNWDKPCEDVVITNCILRSCSKAIVIGYIYSVVRNVMISNCIIRESNRGLCIMCHDECALVENVRVSNCLIDTCIRAGNWWGNGEPIFLMALRHDMHLDKSQKHSAGAACAIRSVHLSGITCMGENAMGIIGSNGNIQNISLENIDYTRKSSVNLPLKGCFFDLAPSDLTATVPADCGLLVRGAREVSLRNVKTGGCRVIPGDGCTP